MNNMYLKFPSTEEKHIEYVQKYFSLDSFSQLQTVSVFGTGLLGRKIANVLIRNGCEIECFIDNDFKKWRTQIDNIPVINPDHCNSKTRVIIASKYVKEIYQQLLRMGINSPLPHYIISILFPHILPNLFYSDAIKLILNNKSEIEKAYNLLANVESKKLFLQIIEFRFTLLPKHLPAVSNNQYFPEDLITLSDKEIYCDVGAYNGDTLNNFILNSKGKFKKYYAFEPDADNYKKLNDNIQIDFKDKIVTENVGVGAQNSLCKFSDNEGEVSSISDNGNITIQIVSLDNYFNQKDAPTQIKIDVEGFELDVLNGAKNIIKKHRPILAVSIYHRPDHLWTLLQIIYGFSDRYLFYIKHHEYEIYDTVLYAIPQY